MVESMDETPGGVQGQLNYSVKNCWSHITDESQKHGAKEVKHKAAHDVTVWLYVYIYEAEK